MILNKIYTYIYIYNILLYHFCHFYSLFVYMICNRMSNLLSAWIKYLREDPRSPNPETPPHAKICHDMPHVLLTCVHLCATCTCEHDRASIESKDDIQKKKLPTSHRPSSHIQHHRGDKTDSPTIAPRQNT